MPYQNQVLRRADVPPMNNLTALHRRRGVLEAQEPEDAMMTGMTRSLDRRLLALNLPRTEAKRCRVGDPKLA